MIDETKVKQVLDYWKNTVSKGKKDPNDNFDLTAESTWIRNAEEAEKAVNDIKKAKNTEQLRNALKEVLTKKRIIWAEPLRLMGTFLNSASKNELEQARDIVLEIKSNATFKKDWTQRIYELINNKYPDSVQKFGESRTKAFIMNKIGEMFGKLHPNQNPVYNNCSASILEKLGFEFDDKDYSSFRKSFDEFKALYEKHLGKLSDKEMNFLIEIDQMFNFFDKNKKNEAGEFLHNTMKGLKVDLQISQSAEKDYRHREVSGLLLDKKQIIFYGPPGTGKTYEAQRFAVKFLLGSLSGEEKKD